jgi:hypothetical protein
MWMAQRGYGAFTYSCAASRNSEVRRLASNCYRHLSDLTLVCYEAGLFG